jgi:hypothetical protein
MTKRTPPQTAGRARTTRTLRDLHELIAALDRRVPRVERCGEAAIARAAAKLRDDARKRVAELERQAVMNRPL